MTETLWTPRPKIFTAGVLQNKFTDRDLINPMRKETESMKNNETKNIISEQKNSSDRLSIDQIPQKKC